MSGALDIQWAPPLTSAGRRVEFNRHRLRYTRKGWYRLCFRMATGHYDMARRVTVPDEYGCFFRDVWAGPYPTAGQACANADYLGGRKGHFRG